MSMQSAWKLVGGIAGAMAGVAKHALWYVRYQVGGTTHDHPEQPAGERKS